jgi:hypothetical protein
MVFFEMFQYNKENFSQTDIEKSQQLRKMLETAENKVAPVNADQYNKDYLALVGNIATSGIMKAKDFVKEDGSSIKEVSLFPKNLKISDGQLEVNGSFTANGEFVIKNNNKVVYKVDNNGNVNNSGQLSSNSNINTNQDIVFKKNAAQNKGYIIHVPNDNRRTMYIAPRTLDNKNWNWGNQVTIHDGKIKARVIEVGNHDVPHPDNIDGAFYRADGQVQIATDDLVRVRHIGTKQTGIQLDARPGEGDMRNPNGQMKITRQGIMFGGPNGAGKQVDSAQISAGRHVANSLNIVGMSSDNNAANRQIDVWAEKAMHVRSNTGLTVHGHGRNTSYGSVNGGWSHLITTAPQFYMNKPLQVNGGVSTYNNKPLSMPHGATTNKLCIGSVCLEEKNNRLQISAPVDITSSDSNIHNLISLYSNNDDHNYIEFRKNSDKKRRSWVGYSGKTNFGNLNTGGTD